MYPDFSYLLHDLFGTEPDNWASVIKTFGFFLAAAIGVAAYFFYIELKRKAKQGIFPYAEIDLVEGLPASKGEILSNAVFGFILGFKIPYAYANFEDFKLDPASILLSGSGNWIIGLVAAALFGVWRWYEKDRKKLAKPKKTRVQFYPHDKIMEIAMVAAFSGVLGAKVFDILEHLDDFFQDPLGVLLSGSGLAIYGGLIFGYIAVVWYLRKNFKGISILQAMDAVAPSMILGYGVGRMGCQFSGDGDWGIPVKGVNNVGEAYEFTKPGWVPDWLWSQSYPHNIAQDGTPIPGCEWHYCMELVPGVFPTPLYEIIMSLAIFGILWALRKRLKAAGMLFFIYMIFNGIERFFVEKIRVNIEYDYFGLNFTQAQYIAILLIVGGVIGVIWSSRRSRQV